MNIFNFVGRATGDPDIKYSGQKNTCVATINMAIPRDFKRDGDPDADFFSCVAFGKTAEAIEKYVSKGTKLICTAHVQNNNYEKDGVKHYGVKILLDKWEFAESKRGSGEAGPSSEKKSDEDFMPIPKNLDIDMPFA